MAKSEKYKVMAHQILELVGGKSNISSITHCVTRLRFNLKDQSIANQEAIKQIPDIIGCQFAGDQFQVIVGPDVKKVFYIISSLVEGTVKKQSEEKVKEKWTIKSIGSKIVTTFSSCITPALPVIMCAGMLKVVIAVLGPTLLNVVKEGTDLFTILIFVGDAGFYFLPIYLGYTSAKYFKTSVFIGMLLGAILVHPALISMVVEGIDFHLLGLPVTAVNYAYSVLPIVLIVWVMSYVRSFLEKIIPATLQIILVDVTTVLVMLPLALCILGPLGSILSGYVNVGFLAIHNVLGPIGIGLIAAVSLLLIITGMHHAVNFAALVVLSEVGYDSVVFVALGATVISVLGANLGFIIKSKSSENRSLAISATFMQAVAGVVEPTLFGIYLPYKKVFLAQAIGAFCGATVMGLLGVKMYALTGSNVLVMTGFLGGGLNNFIYACIGCVISAVVAFIATLVIGIDEN